ncbi:hypothetical protein [Pseudanabaena sp. UWO311]|nr:hypothetical protein [Pseudanabaena sp. UWO311]
MLLLPIKNQQTAIVPTKYQTSDHTFISSAPSDRPHVKLFRNLAEI